MRFRSMTLKSLLLLFLLIVPVCLVAQDDTTDNQPTDSIDRLAPDFVTASICLADPTDWHDDLLGVLGHAFIRLQCPTYQLDYCFSYEGESANENLSRLLTGDLKMGLFAAPTQEYIEPYQRWNRTIREYTLNLPPEAELRLWETMDKHLEEGIDLPLDLTTHGCVQTIVQNVTLALDTTEIVYGKWPEEFKLSRYEIIDRTLAPYPWLRLLAKCLGMYGSFDQPCSNDQKIILPRQIAEVWQQATVNGKPLLTYRGTLTEGASPVVEPPFFTPIMALIVFLIVVATLMIIVRKRRNK